MPDRFDLKKPDEKGRWRDRWRAAAAALTGAGQPSPRPQEDPSRSAVLQASQKIEGEHFPELPVAHRKVVRRLVQRLADPSAIEAVEVVAIPQAQTKRAVVHGPEVPANQAPYIGEALAHRRHAVLQDFT